MASSSSSNFQTIFNASLQAYENKTKNKLLDHPLATQLQSCDSPNAVLSVLQDLIQQFDQRRAGDERLKNWLNPTVNVLYTFSATLGEGVGLTFPAANVIFAGIGVLLLAAKDVNASQDMLIDLFERIESFFKRLESYTALKPSEAMTDMMAKIMEEVLSIMAIVTAEVQLRRRKKFLKKLLGRNDVADALKRLDKLTQEEARMATAEILKISHSVDGNVKILIDDDQQARAVVQQEKLRKWLSPPDSSTNHNLACKAHHNGTATWFFQSGTFKKWKWTPSLLWIYGKPGSGKSVLCSGIIEDIMALQEAESARLAYFYCDFRDEDKQNCRNLVISILLQLATQSSSYCNILSLLHSTHDHGERNPSDGTLTQYLKKMLSLPTQAPVYLIIDALDECPNHTGLPTSREEVLDLIQDLVDLHLPNVHICVTSRPEIDIQRILEPLTSLRMSLHNQSGQIQDIMDYVSYIVYSDRMMRRWNEEDRSLVIKTLSERADGMFQWVYCQLEVLRQCLPPSVRRTLAELPESLDKTYERVLKDINKVNREHAIRLLHCLTVAVRPLRVEELAEVLAVDFDAARREGIPKLNPNWRWADHHQAVLSTCSSLIAIVNHGDSQVVQFSHFSVKEYLTSDRLANANGDVSHYHIIPESAHTILAQACLGILFRFVTSDRLADVNEDVSNYHILPKSELPFLAHVLSRFGDHADQYTALDHIPLVRYAGEQWVGHAQFKGVSSRIRDAMEYFFDADKPHFAAWHQVHDIDNGFLDMFPIRRGSPLYFASLCGFYDLANHLVVKHPEHVNAEGGSNKTPLGAALYGKHLQVAELLYEHGARVHILGVEGRTILHSASWDGSVDAVRWLLNHGADANDDFNIGGWTPLHLAVSRRHIEIIRMLLEHHVDIHRQNDRREIALHLAAWRPVRESESGPVLRYPRSRFQANLNILQLLLDHGADVNTKDYYGSTPLHHSSFRNEDDDEDNYIRFCSGMGTVEGARLLLEHGANIDAEDNNGDTPFQVALEAGHHEMVVFLWGLGSTFQ